MIASTSEAGRKQSGPAALSYVCHQTRKPAPKWQLGLDLGQRRDHSAISVLDLEWIERGRCPTTFGWLFEPQLTLRGLERVPLGTSYEDIHLIIADKLDLLERRIAADTNRPLPARELIIDAGGPGPPMVDRLRRTLKGAIRITPVIITGGKGENSLTGGYVGVPRRTLVTQLIQMISCQTIRCPRELIGWKEFAAEMLELSGDRTQPESPNSHDDLVMSTGLAAWAAIRDTPELRPGATGKYGDNGPTYGFIDKPLF
jgi:hypothetical protein